MMTILSRRFRPRAAGHLDLGEIDPSRHVRGHVVDAQQRIPTVFRSSFELVRLSLQRIHETVGALCQSISL